MLIVTDAGVRDAGHLSRVRASCDAAGLRTSVFDAAVENPTTATVRSALAAARGASALGAPIDGIIGLGGGSAMDCAKGLNLVYSCGGEIASYRGDPLADTLAARTRLLPSILIPTTAGTGSEAQSFALISDERTHTKMACGDRRPPTAGGLRPWLAILDPDLTRTCPIRVAVCAALDALTHALETSACRVRNDVSREASRRAWSLLSTHFEPALSWSADERTRSTMLLGAHLAGFAIEGSMLGAAHATANPLTAVYGITHGIAVAVMMPHVIRFNTDPSPSSEASRGDGAIDNPYSDLGEPLELAALIERCLSLAGAPPRLREHGVELHRLPELAGCAAKQWTAGFNPRPVGESELLTIYEAAY